MALPVVPTSEISKRFSPELRDIEFPDDFVSTLAQDAVDILQVRYGPRIQARLSSGLLTRNLYQRTVAEMVLRVLRNTSGYKSEVDGNYQYELWMNVASGELDVTPKDLLNLLGTTSETSWIGTAAVGHDLGGV